MTNFEVNDMTCGHCVNAITQAVKAVDPQASVSIDLGSKRVQVDSSVADVQTLKSAITEAGYTPVESAATGQPAAAGRSAGCCGGCH